jgi:hypothetical protein
VFTSVDCRRHGFEVGKPGQEECGECPADWLATGDFNQVPLQAAASKAGAEEEGRCGVGGEERQRGGKL